MDSRGRPETVHQLLQDDTRLHDGGIEVQPQQIGNAATNQMITRLQQRFQRIVRDSAFRD